MDDEAEETADCRVRWDELPMLTSVLTSSTEDMSKENLLRSGRRWGERVVEVLCTAAASTLKEVLDNSCREGGQRKGEPETCSAQATSVPRSCQRTPSPPGTLAAGSP
jgi:hypothetical protein